MAVYLISLCRGVSERRRLEEYWQHSSATFAGTGGKPLSVYRPMRQLEGTTPVEGAVVFEFPSMEVALRWYESDAYQKVKQLRAGAAEFDLILVEAGVTATEDRMPHLR